MLSIVYQETKDTRVGMQWLIDPEVKTAFASAAEGSTRLSVTLFHIYSIYVPLIPNQIPDFSPHPTRLLPLWLLVCRPSTCLPLLSPFFSPFQRLSLSLHRVYI